MRRPEHDSRTSVAIIGTGMAGLVTAYLLNQDPNRRFDVEIFESQDKLSLDSASVTIPAKNGNRAGRIDQPMRGFDQGFYPNLKNMYDHLGVRYNSQQFLFSFSRLSLNKPKHGSTSTSTSTSTNVSFVHSSNNHRIPPIRPEESGFLNWVAETIYLAVCFLWFTACCFLVPPKQPSPRPRQQPGGGGDDGLSESLGQYLSRIHIPSYFVERYLYPPLSAMSTCSHHDLSNFPASDVVDYIQRTYNAPHYLVGAGVSEVQDKISQGIKPHMTSRVTSVRYPGSESGSGSGVLVSWEAGSSSNNNNDDDVDINEKPSSYQKRFDHVILAVPPNVVGAIFEPLRKEMAIIPTTPVESIIHTDTTTLPTRQSPDSDSSSNESTFQTQSDDETQWIHLRSTPDLTEAVHEHPSSVIITNFPIAPIDPKKILHRSQFTRTLRSPESRRLVNRLFDKSPPSIESESENEKEIEKPSWRNGDGNVWLVGSWCWDGMVLLEGCVVSAMRVADELGVETPWSC